MERNMDESRKQFQSWFEEWFGESPLTPWNELWCDDGYSAEDIDHMWDAWKGSRAAIELDIDWPESNDDFWKDGEEGAYAMGYEDGRDKTVIAVMKAIRAAGIKVKE